MAERLLIVHGNCITKQTHRFAALSQLFGLKPEYIPLRALESTDLKLSCLVVDAATVGHALQAGLIGSGTRCRLMEEASCVLIHLLCPNQESHAALRWVTADENASIQAVDYSGIYAIDACNEYISAELSDIQWESANTHLDSSICLRTKKADYTPIITLGNGSFLSMGKVGTCTVFLLANGSFIDIEDTVTDIAKLKPFCTQFAPALMVLRFAFGTKCWHVNHHYANFIIDDPYLRPRYGCIRMGHFFEQIHQRDLAITFAFIPWNYRRTHKNTARLVRTSQKRIGICIHGCNHTNHEFGISDIQRLTRLTQDALIKMEWHASRSGIRHQDIMVFPQGVFSTAAMGVLKQHNFRAIVNSTPQAVDRSSMRLKYRHLLTMAVTVYEDAPLFIRHYPYEDTLEYRLDAFLGKPLLFVEHQGFLTDSYANLIQFTNRVNSFPFPIIWTSLDEILDNGYQVRSIKPNMQECLVYSNAIVLANSHDYPMRYRVIRKERNPTSLAGVLCNDAPLEYSTSRDKLVCEITLEPGSQKRIIYRYKKPPCSPFHYSFRDSCSIAVRRILCDIRDNYISNRPKLFSMAQRLRTVGIRSIQGKSTNKGVGK